MIKWSELSIKFNNGVWKLWDMNRFQDVAAFESAADLKFELTMYSAPARLFNEIDSIVLSH